MRPTPPLPRSHLTNGMIALALLLTPSSAKACGEGAASITALQGPVGMLVQANALGSSGKVTGYAYNLFPFSARGFLFSGGITTTFGTLGGSDSQGVAINSSGQVAGDSSLANGFQRHAILYSGGTLTDLGTLGGTSSAATAINDAGQVTGYANTAGDSATHAFLYASGVMISIGTLGGNFSSGYVINQAGGIAGDSTTTGDAASHGFLYADGAMIDLGSLGGDYSSVWALNDAGVVVGESANANFETHAFIHAGGVMTDLGTLGGTYSSAMAINTNGLVTGVATTANDDETHGFAYGSNAMIDLGTFGGSESVPSAINNLGQIVGYATDTDGNPRAFLWQDGVMTDLNSLLPAGTEWELQVAQLINDSGRIVGVGLHNGAPETFVFDPGSGNNHPPVAVAGADQSVECGATVTLNGSQSSDPDGDTLTFQWSENGVLLGTNAGLSVSLGLGPHALTLAVTDPCGATSQASVLVSVTDSTAPTVSCPGALAASTDANCQALVPNVISLATAADNCTAASAVVLSQIPPAGSLVGPGTHTITVTATDASGNTATCEAPFTVADTTAPTIASGPTALTVSAGNDCNGAVPDVLQDIVASDNCTPANQLSVSQSPVAGSPVPMGQHLITVTVTDAAGNSSMKTAAVAVVDATAPTITSVSASPNVLSPPNHQMVPVAVTVVASDGCDGAPVNKIRSVTCNEPVATGDIQVKGDLTVNLAASKNSTGNERVYTITVQSTDVSGNSATATLTVTVPKSNGKAGNNKP